jgi:uncharacterized lipoprotein
MNRLLSRSAVLLLIGVLAGCSGNILPESKKIEYKSAGKLPPLEIPPDLTQQSRDERYTVPDVSTSKGSATYSAYSSERSGQARTTTAQDLLPQVDKMRIERSGTQRWLVVAGSPDKLWPGVKEFWQELGFLVNVEIPEAGIMETDWAENRAKLPQTSFAGPWARFSTVFIRQRSATSSAPAWRRARKPAWLRSTSAIAACTRFTPTRARPKPGGNRARQIPNLKPKCWGA